MEAGTAGGTTGARSGNGALLRDILYIEFEYGILDIGHWKFWFDIFTSVQ